MIQTDMLDVYTDEDIVSLKVLAHKILKSRDDGRKTKAMEEGGPLWLL
jgi:hypothetical protein